MPVFCGFERKKFYRWFLTISFAALVYDMMKDLANFWTFFQTESSILTCAAGLILTERIVLGTAVCVVFNNHVQSLGFVTSSESSGVVKTIENGHCLAACPLFSLEKVVILLTNGLKKMNSI